MFALNLADSIYTFYFVYRLQYPFGMRLPVTAFREPFSFFALDLFFQGKKPSKPPENSSQLIVLEIPICRLGKNWPPDRASVCPSLLIISDIARWEGTAHDEGIRPIYLLFRRCCIIRPNCCGIYMDCGRSI
jgi:hypothetical protein